ncbi:hypothetical protein LJC01_01015 [Clostridiaceae bacterium OttesenSCG-928-D20]|nr:hypothetical protein [Clostridiaceae bacterium OttesenSCG-928-D20]
MNKNQIKISLISLLTVICFVTAIVIPSFSVSGEPAENSPEDTALETGTVSSKEEVIYCSLDSNGDAAGVYVVNSLQVNSKGEITDFGEYESVLNLSDTSPITYSNGKISAQSEKGVFRYQGNMENAELPWSFKISYSLDGKKIDPSELGGKDGELEISIKVSQNSKADSAFFENYMLQISVSLDGNNCQNISSPDATIANAGKSKLITHTVMPGKEADISIKAKVESFAMPAIEIAGMPFSMAIELPDTDEMLGEMLTLSDAISELNKGVGDLSDGVKALDSGAASLVSGSSEFSGGLSAVSSNSKNLTAGSAQIKAALEQISAGLSGGGLDGDINLSGLSSLSPTLRQLGSGLSQMSAALLNLQSGLNTIYTNLDSSIMAIPNGSLTQEQIASLYAVATEPSQIEILNQLSASYSAAQTVKGTYTYGGDASIRSSLKSIAASLSVIANGDGSAQNPGASGIAAALNKTADGIDATLQSSSSMQQLMQLAEGLQELSQQYVSFHEGLTAYTGGVSELSSNYSKLHSGLSGLKSGTSELKNGVNTLHDGTSEMAEQTADLPDDIQVEIDSLMSDYDKSDFTPVSFTSAKNKNVKLVQFVFMTDQIELPEAEAAEEEQAVSQSVLDRLFALFK